MKQGSMLGFFSAVLDDEQKLDTSVAEVSTPISPAVDIPVEANSQTVEQDAFSVSEDLQSSDSTSSGRISHSADESSKSPSLSPLKPEAKKAWKDMEKRIQTILNF